MTTAVGACFPDLCHQRAREVTAEGVVRRVARERQSVRTDVSRRDPLPTLTRARIATRQGSVPR